MQRPHGAIGLCAQRHSRIIQRALQQRSGGTGVGQQRGRSVVEFERGSTAAIDQPVAGLAHAWLRYIHRAKHHLSLRHYRSHHKLVGNIAVDHHALATGDGTCAELRCHSTVHAIGQVF